MSNQNQDNSVMCVVKSNPSQPVASKFNGAMRQSITVQINQDVVQLWENCPCNIAAWERGQTQRVRKNHKGNWESVESYGEANTPLVQTATPMATPQRQAPQTIPAADIRHEAVNYVRFQVAMYKGIFEEVQKTMQDKGLDVSLEKDIATTIYIQTVRRFSM